MKVNKIVRHSVWYTRVHYVSVDLVVNEIIESEVKIMGRYSSTNKLENEVSAILPEGQKLVSIKGTNYTRITYGLNEYDFIENAVILNETDEVK